MSKGNITFAFSCFLETQGNKLKAVVSPNGPWLFEKWLPRDEDTLLRYNRPNVFSRFRCLKDLIKG